MELEPLIPVKLTLTNFMSYREPATIEFDEIEMACLSGKNGAGKSALLDAMTWAIWGKTRGRSDREVISIGEDFMEVTFEFRIGEREYQAFRRRTAGNRLTLHFYSRQVGAESFDMVSGDTAKETQERITNTLKIDYETFVHSAFLMQGKADSFTQMRPGERKRILGEILNLGDYDDLARTARQKKNATKTRLSTLHEQIEQAEDRLKSRPDIEQSLKDLEAEQLVISNDLEKRRLKLQALSSQLQTYEMIVESQKKAQDRLANAITTQNKMKLRLSEIQSALEKTESQLSREAAILTAVVEYRKWRSIADESAEILIKRQPIERKISLAQREVDRQANLIDREFDQASEQVERCRKILDEYAIEVRKMSELEAEAASAAYRIAAMSEVIAEIEALSGDRLRLQAQNSKLSDDAKEIKDAIDALRNGDATCPVCRKPFDVGDHEHIEAEWEHDLELARESYRKNTKQLNVLNKKFEQLEITIKNKESLQAEQNRRLATIEQIKMTLRKKPEIEQGLTESTKTLAELTRKKTLQTFAKEERAVLAEAQRKLDQLDYDSTLHQESQKQLQILSNAEQELSELEQTRIQAGNLKDNIVELSERLHILDSDISDCNRELAEYEVKLTEATAVVEEHRIIQDSILDLENRFANVRSGIGGARNQLDQLTQIATHRSQLKQSQKKLALEADAYEELGTAFGINGIQAMVIENILPEIQDDANVLLQRMSTNHLHVSFRTTRQAVTNDRVSETLDIIIRDEAGERSYDLYSGGETFRINFAIRIALSKLLARRAGATIGLLIIDEGFGTQDSQGKDGLVEALNSIQDYFEMILVITHIEDLRDQFDSRIDVVKAASGSQISLN